MVSDQSVGEMFEIHKHRVCTHLEYADSSSVSAIILFPLYGVVNCHDYHCHNSPERWNHSAHCRLISSYGLNPVALARTHPISVKPHFVDCAWYLTMEVGVVDDAIGIQWSQQ